MSPLSAEGAASTCPYSGSVSQQGCTGAPTWPLEREKLVEAVLGLPPGASLELPVTLPCGRQTTCRLEASASYVVARLDLDGAELSALPRDRPEELAAWLAEGRCLLNRRPVLQ